MAIEWDESLRTGNELIDHQHRELFSRINALLAACGEGRGKQAVAEMIDFLADYVREHFAAEEALMVKAGYPGYAEHKRQHDAFVGRMGQISATLEADGPGAHVVITTNRVVVDWLIEHVRKVDRQLAMSLKP